MENNLNQNFQETHNSVCPGCGADMIFDPETQTLNCPFCENKQKVLPKNEEIKEYDFEVAEKSDSTDWGSEAKVIKCKNCGSEEILDEVDDATKCSFCGSTYITQTGDEVGMAPEGLIPFKISEEKANNMFSEWINKIHFTPNALKTSYKNDKIKGVYIPYWSFNIDTVSEYTAEALVKEGKELVRRPVSGEYSKSYDDILVNASKPIDEKLMDEIKPFEMKELVSYDPKFLSGFSAEKYSIGVTEGLESAKEMIDEELKALIKKDIDGKNIVKLEISTSYNDKKFKYILVPVWISAYTYKDKVYRYLINGQTGEVQGDSPVSLPKFFLSLALFIAVCYFLFRLIFKH